MNPQRISWLSVLVMTLAGCGGRAELEGPRGSNSFDTGRDAGAEDPASVTGGGSSSAGASSTSGGGRGAVAGSSGMSTGGAPASGGRGAVAGSSGMSTGGAPASGGRAGQGGMLSTMPTVRPPRMPPPSMTVPTPPEEPPPAVPLPPGCMTAFQSVSTSGCEHHFYCEDGETYSSCRDPGGDSTTCVCFGPKGQAELTISGASMDSACIIAATECRNPTPPGAEDPVCDVVQESAGVDSCSIARECSTEVETSFGSLIRRRTFENADCSASGDSWECSCHDQQFTDNRQIGVVLGSDLEARAACLRASEVCDEEPFVFSDDYNCEIEHQSASRDFCDAQLSCRVPGTSQEGTQVYAVSYAHTFCQQEGPETWSCQCESPKQGGLMSVSLEAADSWTACQQSVAECFPEGEF